jgi:hypothetical protein
MTTLEKLCFSPFLSLLLIQCSAVTPPQPGETFSDMLSSGAAADCGR